MDFGGWDLAGFDGTYFGKIQAVAGNSDFKRKPQHADIAGG